MTDQVAFRPEQVIERVRSRLIAAGAAVELAILERLDGYELDVLVRRECGWGLWTDESTDSSTDFPVASPTSSQRCPSSSSQTARRTMAA